VFPQNKRILFLIVISPNEYKLTKTIQVIGNKLIFFKTYVLKLTVLCTASYFTQGGGGMLPEYRKLV
jgi:hypothetical protein